MNSNLGQPTMSSQPPSRPLAPGLGQIMFHNLAPPPPQFLRCPTTSDWLYYLPEYQQYAPQGRFEISTLSGFPRPRAFAVLTPPRYSDRNQAGYSIENQQRMQAWLQHISLVRSSGSYQRPIWPSPPPQEHQYQRPVSQFPLRQIQTYQRPLYQPRTSQEPPRQDARAIQTSYHEFMQQAYRDSVAQQSLRANMGPMISYPTMSVHLPDPKVNVIDSSHGGPSNTRSSAQNAQNGRGFDGKVIKEEGEERMAAERVYHDYLKKLWC
jgi:hypothetical protein